MNCRGLNAHHIDILADQMVLKADVLLVQETSLEKDSQEKYGLPGFEETNLHSVAKGKGIASYSKKKSLSIAAVKRDTYQIVLNQCIFSDKQHVKIQEVPESVPEGETPQTIHLCAYEDLVDDVRPGDRVEITGIYKAMGVRVNQNRRTLKNVYRTYIDVITYVKTDKRRFEFNDSEAKGQDG